METGQLGQINSLPPCPVSPGDGQFSASVLNQPHRVISAASAYHFFKK